MVRVRRHVANWNEDYLAKPERFPACIEMLAMKTVFTTGEAAEICSVSQQTIIRCFDKGKVKGFRIPGSKFRRIPREGLMAFMRENGIPLHRLTANRHRVLVICPESFKANPLIRLLDRDDRFELRLAFSAFEAGFAACSFHPQAILVSADAGTTAAEIHGTLRQSDLHAHVRVIIVGKAGKISLDGQVASNGEARLDGHAPSADHLLDLMRA